MLTKTSLNDQMLTLIAQVRTVSRHCTDSGEQQKYILSFYSRGDGSLQLQQCEHSAVTLQPGKLVLLLMLQYLINTQA